METLKIKDLHVEVDGKEILKGVNLEISKGDTLALLGPFLGFNTPLFRI